MLGRSRLERSTTGAYSMSDLRTSQDTQDNISLLESRAGTSPSISLDGGTPQQCLEAVPASPSATPEVKKDSKTNVTSGPCSSISSRSVALQLSLESRLAPLLGKAGSTLYSQTLKVKVSPAGRRYLEHTAQA